MSNNLLIIVADSLRYDAAMRDFGWLRERAVTYTNAWAHAGATIPAFACMWSGQETNAHGATRWPFYPIDPAMGMGSLLESYGYHVYAYTENYFTEWAMPLWSSAINEHLGQCGAALASRAMQSPWVVVWHSMYCHWPYKFDNSDLCIPAGFPSETGIQAEVYQEAYNRGVANLAQHVHALMGSLPGEFTTILTSDHGEQFNEHGEWLHPPKTFFPEQTHVPLIVADGKRTYTDRGLLAMKSFPWVVERAINGTRRRANDRYVQLEDYYPTARPPAYGLRWDQYLQISQADIVRTFDLDTDPDCLSPLAENPQPPEDVPCVPPPLQESTNVWTTQDEAAEIEERLVALGYL